MVSPEWYIKHSIELCVSFFFVQYINWTLGNSSNPGPEVIKRFSCSTQLSMEVLLLINVKMPTIVGILTVMSGKNSILGLSEPKKLNFLKFCYTYEHLKFHAQLS